MKKITLLLTLISSIQLNTKAQNNLLAVSSHNVVLTGNIKYPNKITPATTIYPLSDSTRIVKDYAYYMQKSKGLRTTGLIFLGTGILLSSICLFMKGIASIYGSGYDFGVRIIITGAFARRTSIPLMITGHTYRIKAKALLKNQKTGLGVPPNVSKDIAGITLSFSLGK